MEDEGKIGRIVANCTTNELLFLSAISKLGPNGAIEQSSPA